MAHDSGTERGHGAWLDEAARPTPDRGIGEQDVESCLRAGAGSDGCALGGDAVGVV